MLNYILRRIGQAIPTLLIVITASFFLMHVAPGGPFDNAQQLPPEIEANLKAAYHLNLPVWQQYLYYMKDLLHGDFGPSFEYKDTSVTALIVQGFPVSLKLGSWAMLLALVIGIPMGIIAAIRRNSVIDYIVMGIALCGIAIPNFVLAPIMALVFGVFLAWLPAGGWGNGGLSYIVLPVIALSIQQIAAIARLTRASMIEVIESQYIKTAKAKGLSGMEIILRHALRPALLPVLSYLGPAIAAIITGSVVIEQIFGLPGIGRYFVQGALNRDYTLVMGVVVFYAMLIILMNLVVDLLYGFIDPQIALDE